MRPVYAGLASLAFTAVTGRPFPILLRGQADEEPCILAATTTTIYIFDLFAAVAAVFELRRGLKDGKVTLFLDDEAARAALARGSARNRLALALAYTLVGVR